MLIRKSEYTSRSKGERERRRKPRSRVGLYLIAVFLIVAAIFLIGLRFWHTNPPPPESAAHAEVAH
jgi:hypothetical protein